MEDHYARLTPLEKPEWQKEGEMHSILTLTRRGRRFWLNAIESATSSIDSEVGRFGQG